MPKLQSANGRLNVLSKSGCFFYYLFLLFEPCHRTISLQERINNSPRPPRCSVVSHLHPQHFCARDVLKAAKERRAGLLLLLWVWKTWMLEASGDLWYPIHKREESFGMCGWLRTATATLECCKHWSAQFCRDAHEDKVTAWRCLTPICWRWQSPNPWALCSSWGCRTAARHWECRARETHTQGGQVSVTTTLMPAKATKCNCHLLPAKQEEDRWTQKRRSSRDTSSFVKNPSSGRCWRHEMFLFQAGECKRMAS